jgi:RHS repeat-associated protein
MNLGTKKALKSFLCLKTLMELERLYSEIYAEILCSFYLAGRYCDTTGAEKTTEYRYYPGTSRLMTNGKWAYLYDRNGNTVKKGDTLMVEGRPLALPDIPGSYWDTLTESHEGLLFAGSGTQWEYAYDLLNRMIRVKKNGEITAEYTYDGEGLRVRKKTPGHTWYYTCGPGGVLLYEEKDGLSYRQYTYALGAPIAREDGALGNTGKAEGKPVRYFLLTDNLGSVLSATKDDGTEIWENEYFPFGDSVNRNTIPGEEFESFTGKMFDKDAGLMYFNHRWYDSEIGRFTTIDPIRDGMNWYGYCNGNPVNFVDPTGLYGINRYGLALRIKIKNSRRSYGKYCMYKSKNKISTVTRDRIRNTHRRSSSEKERGTTTAGDNKDTGDNKGEDGGRPKLRGHNKTPYTPDELNVSSPFAPVTNPATSPEKKRKKSNIFPRALNNTRNWINKNKEALTVITVGGLLTATGVLLDGLGKVSGAGITVCSGGSLIFLGVSIAAITDAVGKALVVSGLSTFSVGAAMLASNNVPHENSGAGAKGGNLTRKSVVTKLDQYLLYIMVR